MKRVWTIIRILITVFLLGYIILSIDIESIKKIMTLPVLLALIIASGFHFLQAIVCSLRWKLLSSSEGFKPNFPIILKTYLQGMFINTGFPSVVGGDYLRAATLVKIGLPVAHSSSSVFTDRLLGANAAAAISLIFYISILFIANNEIIVGPSFSAISLISLFLFGLSSVWIILVKVVNRLNLSFLPKAVMEGLKSKEYSIYEICVAMVLSVIGYILAGVSVYILAYVLNIDVGFLTIVGITSTVLIVSMVPISIGGWGMREASFAILLTPFAASQESSVILGLLYGFAILLASLPGAWYFLTRDKKISDE